MLKHFRKNPNHRFFSLKKHNSGFASSSKIALALLPLALLGGSLKVQAQTTAPNNPETQVAQYPRRLVTPNTNITVTGEVDEILGPYSFKLRNVEGDFFDDDEIIVIDYVSNLPLVEGEDVRVVGDLRSFTIADIDRDYSYYNHRFWNGRIQRSVEVEYENQPAIVADSVRWIDD